MSWVKSNISGGSVERVAGILPFSQFPCPVFEVPSDVMNFVNYCRTNKVDEWYSWAVTPIDGDSFFDKFEYNAWGVSTPKGQGYSLYAGPSVETAFKTRETLGSRRVAGAVQDAVNKRVGGSLNSCLMAGNYYLYVISSLASPGEPHEFHGGFSFSFPWAFGSAGYQLRRDNLWMSYGGGKSDGSYLGIDYNPSRCNLLMSSINHSATYAGYMSADFRQTNLNGNFDFGEGYEKAIPDFFAPCRTPDYGKQWSIKFQLVNKHQTWSFENMPNFACCYPFENEDIVMLLVCDYSGYKPVNNPNYPIGLS